MSKDSVLVSPTHAHNLHNRVCSIAWVSVGSSCSESSCGCRLLLTRVHTPHVGLCQACSCPRMLTASYLWFYWASGLTQHRDKVPAETFHQPEFQKSLGELVQLVLRGQLRSHRHTFAVVVQSSIQLCSKERIKCPFLSAEAAHGTQEATALVVAAPVGTAPVAAVSVCCSFSHLLLAFCAVQETWFHSVLSGRAPLVCFLFKSYVFPSKPACFGQSVEICLLKMSDFDTHLQAHLVAFKKWRTGHLPSIFELYPVITELQEPVSRLLAVCVCMTVCLCAHVGFGIKKMASHLFERLSSPKGSGV